MERLLGVGGRCAVWLVRRSGGDGGGAGLQRQASDLALKVPLAAPRSPVSVHSVEEELEAMRSLHHPHLVRAWACVETSQGRGLLLDAYPAGSLARILQHNGPLSIGEAITVLVPVAAALEHLHAQGAAHGDVSAANILFSPEGRPALGDLGDAHLLGMAARTADPSDDVRGLGAVLWETLTGEVPEGEATRAPLLAQRPDLPEAAATLVEDALAESDQVRPSAAEFAADLYRCAPASALGMEQYSDGTVLAEVPTRLPAERRSGGRAWSRTALTITASGLVLAAGLLMAGVSVSRDDEDPVPPATEVAEVMVRSADGAVSAERVLQRVAAKRTAALQASDAERISDYAVVGSPVYEADRDLMGEMAAAGLRYDGAPVRMHPLEAETLRGERQQIAAVVTADSLVTGTQESQEVRLTLVREGTSWLLYSVDVR